MSDDFELFRKAMEGVRPLKSKRKSSSSKRISGTVPKPASQPKLGEIVPKPVLPGEKLLYRRANLSQKQFEALKAGRIPIEETLDLHGYRLAEARRIVEEYLEACLQDGVRCLKIIHGKGWRSENFEPVLKRYLAGWLREIPYVAAFCSAPPRDGGTGVLYVLLQEER